MSNDCKQTALDYHAQPGPGGIAVTPTKEPQLRPENNFR